MDKQIELSQTEIELAFASFVIEGTARKLGAALPRGVRTHETGGMIENYIRPIIIYCITEKPRTR